MKTTKFSEHQPGILCRMLFDAYSGDPGIVARYKKDWEEFDSFVFDNLVIMDRNGFVSVDGLEPVGFVSWDPRKLPESLEIGHNCILTRHKGQGKGKKQLQLALGQIQLRNPKKVIVKTGNTPFFLAARKMYESAGFCIERIVAADDPSVPEVVEYVMLL
jgi:ribosomal protein S18 acetylase RimI-like enzyme